MGTSGPDMTDALPPQAGPRTVGYARRLTAWDASMVVVGGVIGSGIFLTPAAIARQTGSGAEQLVAWAIGGALALIGALCYAELGARRPAAGGGYVNLREAFGLIIAFVYGWNMLVVNYSGSLAAVATVFVQYAAAACGTKLADPGPYAVGAIVFLAGINWFGIRAGSITQNVLTVLKLAALAALIAIGLVARRNNRDHRRPGAVPGDRVAIRDRTEPKRSARANQIDPHDERQEAEKERQVGCHGKEKWPRGIMRVAVARSLASRQSRGAPALARNVLVVNGPRRVNLRRLNPVALGAAACDNAA